MVPHIYFLSLFFFACSAFPAVAPDSHSQPAREQTAQRRVSLSSVLPQFNNSHVSSESWLHRGPWCATDHNGHCWVPSSASTPQQQERISQPWHRGHAWSSWTSFFFFSVLLMCELTLFRSYNIGSSPGTGCRPSSSSFGCTISVWWPRVWRSAV